VTVLPKFCGGGLFKRSSRIPLAKTKAQLPSYSNLVLDSGNNFSNPVAHVHFALTFVAEVRPAVLKYFAMGLWQPL